jgi:kinesin family protein 2/24
LENKRLREKKLNKEMKNEAQGKKGDVVFEEMIEKKKYKAHLLGDHITSKQMKLCVCVRKRPIFKHELASGENDCISVANPELKIFT